MTNIQEHRTEWRVVSEAPIRLERVDKQCPDIGPCEHCDISGDEAVKAITKPA